MTAFNLIQWPKENFIGASMISSQPILDKPNFAIFLDIDGVLNLLNPLYLLPNGEQNPLWSSQHELNLEARINTIANEFYEDFAELKIFKAQVHLFPIKAVTNLNELILKIQKIANVHIVISSNWRIDSTVADLKEIFRIHDFSQFITDKTPKNDDEPYENWKNFCEKNDETHGKRCRASEINEFLFNHLEYQGYVIFDDKDCHLSHNFGDKFISIEKHKILTSDHTEKAYAVFLDFMKNLNNENGKEQMAL